MTTANPEPSGSTYPRKAATQSHVNHSVCLWEPQEHEISLAVAVDPADGPLFPFDDFWYLQLAGAMHIGLGRHPESVASDAAAMRKLAALALEVAGELERRAAEQKDGG
jgi:hypothetical protein